jgi:two-component system cell cycle sensor histidine kinase/response regulator CckA
MRKFIQRIYELPLYARLTLFVGIILIFIFSILLLIAQYFYIHVVNQQFELRAKTIANNLAEISIPPLLNSDEVSLGQNCASIAQQKDVHYVTILDANGNILSNPSAYPKDLTSKLKKIFQSFDNPSLLTFKYAEDNSILEVFRVIKIQDVTWGYILLGIDLSDFNRSIVKARWISLAIGLFFILLAIFSVQKITEKVISPIKYLIRGTEEVSAGNFDYKIELKDRGELGQLALKFNEMTVKLNYYYRQKELLHKKLHKYSESLEKNVKERTRQLEQIQNEVVQIFHQIPIGLLTVNKHGSIQWYNEELLNVFDIENKTALKGLNINKKDPFNQDTFLQKIKEVINEDKKTVFQFSYNLSNGERRILDVHAQPLANQSKNDSGMIFIVKDITQETELKKQINRAQRLESMGILAGGMAHDFNNALGIILPNAQMLRLKLKNQKNLLHYVDTIEKATDQAAVLTKQILSFSRGYEKGKPEIFNLGNLINEFTAMLGRVVSRKITIKKELQDKPWNIEADKTQIEQVLMNLSMNAVDAMPKGGELTYRVSNFELLPNKEIFYPDMKKAEYLKLEIIDTGTGIPSQVLDKIFDPFFSSKEEGKGTGLGLSIVYGIVQSCGGVIDVNSEINKGTHFSIFLPATSQKETSMENETYSIPVGEGKILLVDDESMLRETVSHMLESMKFKVTLVNDGKEAVGTYQKKSNEIDLIIMDIQMPEMDGIEAASLIWEKNPDAKIIFSSGYADPARLEELRHKGVKEVLRKPYKMKDLVEIIQKTMSNPKYAC